LTTRCARFSTSPPATDVCLSRQLPRSPLTPPAEYLPTDYSIAKCVFRLLQGELFVTHTEYVRRQIIYCLLQVCETERRLERGMMLMGSRKMTIPRSTSSPRCCCMMAETAETTLFLG
jgi:hypothetical protein